MAELTRKDVIFILNSKKNMAGVDLSSLTLAFFDLSNANLRVTNLTGANLGGANLIKPQLTSAVYDLRTIWPEGFDPKEHGAILVDES